MKATTKETGAHVPANTHEADGGVGRTERRGATRPPYVAPRLERLGEWSALTLQQSIPIFP